MLALDAGRLRALLLSRPCVAAAAPLGSPVTTAAASAGDDSQQHVYVDVVESVGTSNMIIHANSFFQTFWLNEVNFFQLYFEFAT